VENSFVGMLLNCKEKKKKKISLEFFMSCYAAITKLLLQVLMTWLPHLNV